MKKTISILGASGSVGTQALDVARHSGYKVDFISVGSNIKFAEDTVRELDIPLVAVADERAAGELKLSLSDTETKVLSGASGIIEGIERSRSETAINSIIGAAGLLPSLAVIDSGKRLALANKETLVIGGSLVMERARARGCEILPVDSEHSAIFQSLKSGRPSEIKRILLTASGGPFFGKSREELSGVTVADALAHPTWSMGKKITVDSATMMNKGFEIIEAAHLFGVGADKIQVVVHRESILHSAVEYIDNTVIGELSVPDMRMCVKYAVDYPERCAGSSAQLDLFKIGKLTFLPPDETAFPLLSLAKRSLSDGGGMGAVINASDEVAVAAFLEGRLSFLGISEAVEEAYERMLFATEAKTVDELVNIDRMARDITSSIISKKEI